MNYYVTLPSGGSDITSEYGKINNSKSDFETDLKVPLNLAHKKYEVGLTEFSYKRSWKVKLGHFKITSKYNQTAIFFDDDVFAMDGMRITDAVMLINANFINTNKIVDLVVTPTGQIIIKLAPQYTLEIKGYFATLMVKDAQIKTKQNFTFIDIDNVIMERTNTLNLTSVYINYVQEIYIYTNIIDEVHVGNEMLKLLRVVTVSGKIDESICVIFDVPHYLSLDSSYIDRIRMFIRDAQGNKIDFLDSHSQVFYKLHFKLKKLV